MAKLQQRRDQNVSGNFYVDTSCIDCDTCRWMVPQVFKRVGDQTAVHHQPEDESDKLQAMQALLACPTASIGMVEKSKEIKTAQQSFPLPIAENVYHCGYHSASSYGAASYFVQRPEGNILVDSPRFAAPLVEQLESMGGVRWMYLTHQDDIADHQKFQAHFGCERILHRSEITTSTKEIEIQLQGFEPWQLDEDVLIIPVPGHSPGHTVLQYRQKFLFTGDHLAWSPLLNNLYAFRRYCWHSWSKQIESMKKLAEYEFEWVLPGHGRRFHGSRETIKQQMQQCIRWMQEQ